MKLAVLGASYLQEPLLKKCQELGIFTLCFSWLKDSEASGHADLFFPISILEKEKILEKCRQYKVDGILSIASDAAVPTMTFVAEKLNLVGNSILSGKLSTNKFLMRKRLNESCLPVPKFWIINNGIQFEPNFPLIVKPVDRSGSRGIQIVYTENELNQAILDARDVSFSGDVIVEEYIRGSEISIETISWNGNHEIIAVTDKVTSGPPHFVELEHHQPSIFEQHSIMESLTKILKASLDALHIRYGISHTEFLITDNGDVWIVEVGARMGGDFIGSHLVRYSTGIDLVKEAILISLGIVPGPFIFSSRCSGVHFLTPDRLWVRDVLNMPTSVVKENHTFERQVENLTDSSERQGYFIYQGNNRMTMEDFRND